MNRNRRNHQHGQRGFTLAEILVTTAIFAVIMIAALAVYDKSNQVFKSSTEAADLQQSTRVGFDKLVADVRMLGFDYSRGGVPLGTGQQPQPDEQLEYAGVSVLAFRANFNYQTAAASGNGLETAYMPKDNSGNLIFPYVTTSNDEIVIYALKSSDTTKNTQSVSFWADTDKPRSAYAPNGAEKQVLVSGIDTTNANPPYTLYRITVSDILNNLPGTPVAENIRSLTFYYYTDAKGTTVLKNADGPPATDISNSRNADGSTTPATVTINGTTTYTGAIGGDGQYNASNSNTANFNDRTQRSAVQSIRVELIGMNANPDAAYVNTTETIAKIKPYRQYQLSALIVPRNLGLTGFPEPSYTPPGQPSISGICTGHCAAPVICWTPPTAGGPVLQYRIEWDTNPNGAFANALVITDGSQTMAIIPDDNVMDPSKTWYYRIFAQNDNGSSPASNQKSATPTNATKPKPPTNLGGVVATTTHALNAAFTDNAVVLNWSGASANDPPKNTLNCSGGSCSSSGDAIPAQESIKYKLYRGLDINFDLTQAVTVLDTGGKQPPNSGPNAAIIWNDTAANNNSAFPPGTCVPYFYRIQAIDRCAANSAYNASGSINDSISTIYPPVGSQAIKGQAYDAGVQATAPSGFAVNTAASACPAGAGPNCSVALQWSRVTTDTAGNAIGVDKYRLKRTRKKAANMSYSTDTTFGANGTLDITGFSQTTGNITYTDTSGVAVDTSDGQPWTYQYTVQANDCSGGVVAGPVTFPSACSINPIVVEAGAQNPAASGDTPAAAWIMNAGDTITVSPPLSGGIVLNRVQFDVTAYPSGTFVDSLNVTSSPFVYTWSDRTDNQVYQVKLTVYATNGCSEVHIKYVQDQAAAACAYANQAVPGVSNATSGSTTTDSETLTITNGGTDPLKLAGRNIAITWAFPDGSHNDMTLTSVAWHSGAFSTTDNLSSGAAPGTVTRTVPVNMPDIAASGTFSITIRFQYKKQDPNTTVSGISKVCLDYQIASEPGVTKHCNVVGQSASTNNPNACD